jgi:hypothetical protein
MRTRLLVSLLAASALVLAATASASAAPFVATFHAPNHSPKAGKEWPVTVTAKTKSGRKLHATALYEIIEPVSGFTCKEGPDPGHPSKTAKCAAGPRGSKPWPFFGVMHDRTFIWPSRALNIRLILRTVVTVKGLGTVNLNWSVKVHR